MAKYDVTFWEKVTYTTQVNADSEADAIDEMEELIAQDEIHFVSQGTISRQATLIEEPDEPEPVERDGYQTELIDRTAPRWVWELIDETLDNDSRSSAFDPALRKSLSEAIDAMGEACEEGV